MKKIPNCKEKSVIICEGIDDKLYLEKILSFYEIKYDIKIFVSGGKSKIVSTLKKYLKLHSYSKYFIFIDLDGYKNSIDTLKKELKVEQIDYKKDKIFFVNPIIEYLYVINKENTHPSNLINKQQYSPLIKRYYGINEYVGNEQQCKKIINTITRESFEKNITNISNDANTIPSSTINELLNILIGKSK